MGTDGATITRVLSGKTSGEIKALEQQYAKGGGESLRKALEGDLSGDALTRAQALLEGTAVDPKLTGPDKSQAETKAAGARAKVDAHLREAMRGVGTDHKTIHKTLEGKTDVERQAMTSAYQKLYGRDLKADLRSELSGNLLQKTETLLSRGKLSDAEKLHFAVAGAGTDDATIRSVLDGKSKEDVAKIKSEYKQRYGTELAKDWTAIWAAGGL